MELDASGKLVQQKEQPQPTKPAGPPKSIKPNQNSARPKGPPKTKSVDEKFNIEQAASALDVLIKDKADNVNRISGWEELPPVENTSMDWIRPFTKHQWGQMGDE